MIPVEQRPKPARASHRSSSSTVLFSIVLGVIVVLCAVWALSSYRNNAASVENGVTTGQGIDKTPSPPKSESKTPPSADPAPR